jgi:hypothetical protein
MTVLSVNAGMLVGADYLWVARRSDAGYPLGASLTSTPVNDTLYSALKHYGGYVDIESGAFTESIAQLLQGNTIKAQSSFGIRSFESFNMTLGSLDPAFWAVTQGIAADATTNEGFISLGENLGQSVLPNLFIGAGTQFVDIGGNAYYATMIYQNAQTRIQFPGANQNDGVNPNPVVATVTPSKSSRDITGESISDTHKYAFRRLLISRYPVHVATFISDGSETTFTLPYLPVYSTANGEDDNIITRNGATLAVTSVNTSTGVVTMSAAGTAGDVNVVVYQVSTDWTVSP